MKEKPPDLVYGLEDQPPWRVALLLGLQHAAIAPVAFVLPALVARAAGAGPLQMSALIKLTLLTMGIATILQGLRRIPVGSGYLCPTINGPAFMGASLMAAQTGGLSLVCGMTALSGAFQAALSRVIRRLRPLFPPEVVGLVALMVAMTAVLLATPRFVGRDAVTGHVDGRCVAVAAVTFLAMVAPTIWLRGPWRFCSLLIGLAIGYTASAIAGLVGREQLDQWWDAPWLSYPEVGAAGWSFSAAMIFPFLVATLCSTLKGVSDFTICQKVNDPGWTRPDMDSISRGVLGLGLGNVIAGLAGGLGLSTSTGNVGLSVATGATSRVLAFFAGGILIALAFLPKAAAIFVLAPQPVLAACLIFVTMFMIVAGIQMINSRMLDARRTFVIGLALSFGLSVNTLPALYNSLPAWVRPFTASSLTLAALLAVVINAVFRLGVAKSADLPLLPGDSAREKISRFMEDRGSQWGARRDVIQRAIASAVAVADALRTDNLARDRVILTASFDEFDLGLSVRYSGHSWSAPAEQAGSLADEVRSESINDACSIRLHFVH